MCLEFGFKKKLGLCWCEYQGERCSEVLVQQLQRNDHPTVCTLTLGLLKYTDWKTVKIYYVQGLLKPRPDKLGPGHLESLRPSNFDIT